MLSAAPQADHQRDKHSCSEDVCRTGGLSVSMAWRQPMYAERRAAVRAHETGGRERNGLIRVKA